MYKYQSWCLDWIVGKMGVRCLWYSGSLAPSIQSEHHRAAQQQLRWSDTKAIRKAEIVTGCLIFFKCEEDAYVTSKIHIFIVSAGGNSGVRRDALVDRISRSERVDIDFETSQGFIWARLKCSGVTSCRSIKCVDRGQCGIGILPRPTTLCVRRNEEFRGVPVWLYKFVNEKDILNIRIYMYLHKA